MRLLHLHHGLAGRVLPSRNTCSITITRTFSNSPVPYDISLFARRLFKLPSAPSPPSNNHNSLTTFLSYAKSIGLPTTSTVYVGTHYEYTVLQSLRRYALALHRIGGRDDAGVDLVGTWHLPGRERERAIRVLVQCKALKSKLGPNIVRELEGTFRQAPVGWRTGQTVGVLVSPREATKGVRDAMARSSYHIFWMMIERDGTLKQALWNARAEELELSPLGVETRYGSPSSDSKSGALAKEITLTWDGCDIPNMDTVELDLARSEEQWVASWGADLADVDKGALLDTVERLFPDGYYDTKPDETVSENHRKQVVAALREQ